MKKTQYSSLPQEDSSLLPTERKIDQMNKAALSRFNTLYKPRKFLGVTFSIRELTDYPRIKLQTRITEKPPVLETNELTVPFLGKFSVANLKPAIEATGAAKKAILAMKEESEHLISIDDYKDIGHDLTKLKNPDAIVYQNKETTTKIIATVLYHCEETIKDPNATTKDKKQTFAQQKKLMHLYSELHPTFMSHAAKLKIGFTRETEAQIHERVHKEAVGHIVDFNKMKATLQDQSLTSSAQDTKTLLSAKTRSVKSMNR